MNLGDDITVSGKLVRIEYGCLFIRTPGGKEFWISPEDIKTWRPLSGEHVSQGTGGLVKDLVKEGK